jgi:hypothetical protein
MGRITHFGVVGWCTRTVGSSGLKLKAKLGHISPAAMRRAKSYIDLKPPEVARGRDPALDFLAVPSAKPRKIFSTLWIRVKHVRAPPFAKSHSERRCVVASNLKKHSPTKGVLSIDQSIGWRRLGLKLDQLDSCGFLW